MASPRPYRVEESGDLAEAPVGSVPIALYGAGGGGGGGVQPDDPRLPIVLTRAAYDALNPPVPGQVYLIQG